MPFDRHIWILNMQLNGTFTLALFSNNKQLLSNTDNTLVCNIDNGGDFQLWRREGRSIKSEKADGYLGITYPAFEEYVNVPVPPPINSTGDGCVSRPEHTNETTVLGHPTLTISSKADVDKKQVKSECATTKVVRVYNSKYCFSFFITTSAVLKCHCHWMEVHICELLYCYRVLSEIHCISNNGFVTQLSRFRNW